MDLPDLQKWIGKTETQEDEVTAAPVRGLAATLDRDDPPPRMGDSLPPLWHWLYFLPHERQSDLGEDGHARRGGFLPPVPLPRRMWAGGRFEFHRALKIGDRITRSSRIESVVSKQGRSGALVFVVVRHEIATAAEGIAITEEHDIVYRDHPPAGDSEKAAPPPAPGSQKWERIVRPDDVLLFRYSALTFNGHRIHYDRRYATGAEAYPGLVVHGPLIATLLLDLVRREAPESVVAAFRFRAVSPLFDLEPFSVCGQPSEDGASVRLWAKSLSGAMAMDAEATLSLR